MHSPLFPLALAALATLALARTDLSGCTSSETVIDFGASYVYWVPGTGEICSLIDCGGGRAPPATTVPGCPQYVGTATYSPQYLPGYGDSIASSTTSLAGVSTSQSSALITASQTTSAVASQQTTISSSSSVITTSGSVISTSKSASMGFVTNTSALVSSSTSGMQSTKSSTSSSSPAASPTATGNSGAKVGAGYLPHVMVGALAAGFAFLL